MNFEKIGSNEPSRGLGSLTQAARSKELKTARGLLIFVGGWLLFNAVLQWFMGQNEIDKARQMGVGAGIIQQAQTELMVATGVFVLLAVVYFVFAVYVKSNPVPITITALVIFIGFIVILAALNPENIYRGWLVKAIVIIGLAKAIQSAIAYQREVAGDRNLPATAPQPPLSEPHYAPEEEGRGRRATDW